MVYFKALVLSLVQGIAEFLPISSSAHLILLDRYMNFASLDGELFNAVIQLASTLAIVVFFRKKLFLVLFTLHSDEKSRLFAYKFALAFLPSAVVGLLFYKYIKQYFYGNLVIAVSLILGGLVLIAVDKCKKNNSVDDIDAVDLKSSFNIGLFQIVSFIPGVSRSGSTIVGGLLNGLSKKVSVEFSFILAIPTTLSATIFDLYNNIGSFSYDSCGILIFGFLATFVISLMAIKFLLNYLSSHSFDAFGYYRIVLGLVIIMLTFL